MNHGTTKQSALQGLLGADGPTQLSSKGPSLEIANPGAHRVGKARAQVLHAFQGKTFGAGYSCYLDPLTRITKDPGPTKPRNLQVSHRFGGLGIA